MCGALFSIRHEQFLQVRDGALHVGEPRLQPRDLTQRTVQPGATRRARHAESDFSSCRSGGKFKIRVGFA
jgi:hypothetical protein